MEFKDKDIAKLKINKTQTADDLLDDITTYDSYFTGFYLNVQYDIQGNPAAVYQIPVEKVRKNDDGSFRYNERMGEPKGYKEAGGHYLPAVQSRHYPQVRDWRVCNPRWQNMAVSWVIYCR